MADRTLMAHQATALATQAVSVRATTIMEAVGEGSGALLKNREEVTAVATQSQNLLELVMEAVGYLGLLFAHTQC